MTNEEMKEMRLKSAVPVACWILASLLLALISMEIIIRMAYFAEHTTVPSTISGLLNALTIATALMYSVWRFVVFYWSKREGWLFKLEALLVLATVGYFGYRFLLSGGSAIVVLTAFLFGILAGVLDLRILGKEKFSVMVVSEVEDIAYPAPELEEASA